MAMPIFRKAGKSRVRKPVRRSVSLPLDIDTKIRTLARHQNRSANQVIEKLIATGLEAKEAEKRRFFEAAERFRATNDPAELQEAKEELARMVFGV